MSLDERTDLPLSQCGSGGSRGALDADRLLAAALRVVPGQPERLDSEAVRAWVEAATAGLAYRRQAWRMAREVDRVLFDEWRTAQMIARQRETLQRRREIRAARTAGTHWSELEQGRTARRVVHVQVDRSVWDAVKANLRQRGVTAGEGLGRLVAREVRRRESGEPARRGDEGPASTERLGRRANLTTRIAIDDATWAAFAALAVRDGRTVARYLGEVIESATR